MQRERAEVDAIAIGSETLLVDDPLLTARDVYRERSLTRVVFDRRLRGRTWIMGDEFTVADIATFPWVRNLVGFYGAGELVEIQRFHEVRRTLDAFLARPAVQRGLSVPG